MSELLKILATENGFIDAFWAELSRRHRLGQYSTHREVFEYLNDKYEEETGEPRFPSFDAFRMRRDRKTRRMMKK